MNRLAPLVPGIEGHASGAAWIAHDRVLLVADLHLGRGWAQRRRGELWPVSGGVEAAKLDEAIDELLPRQIVFLGDLVHAPKPALAERAEAEAQFLRWKAKAALFAVRGNHDRWFDRDYARLEIPVADSWESPGLLAIHGDRPRPIPENTRIILGHLHPALRIEDAAGVGHKLRAFLVGERTIVLPAFSPLAAGVSMWRRIPRELEQLDGSRNFEAAITTGKRVLRVGPLARYVDAAEARGTSPEGYQRHRRT